MNRLNDKNDPNHANSVSGTGIDPRQFRNALGRFASGVTVITTQHEDHTHGMTANAFVSVSLVPPLILVSVDKRAKMHQLLATNRRYGVSVLGEDQEALSNHFAGRTVDDLEISFMIKEGVPLLMGAVAHLIARVVDRHAAGDHTLYIGQVEYVDWKEDGRPLLFYAGKYYQLSEKQPRPVLWAEDEFSLFSIGNFNLP